MSYVVIYMSTFHCKLDQEYFSNKKEARKFMDILKKTNIKSNLYALMEKK